ncbi:MAG: VanZ family protein [Candidatus Promineifilaceae bacterium]
MLEKIPFPDSWRQRQVLFVCYIIIVAVVTLFPADSSEIPIKHIDKVGHFIAYVGMAVLALTCFKSRSGQISAVVAAAIISGLLELAQTFVPGRIVSLTDGIANILGILIGILLYSYFQRRIHPA